MLISSLKFSKKFAFISCSVKTNFSFYLAFFEIAHSGNQAQGLSISGQTIMRKAAESLMYMRRITKGEEGLTLIEVVIAALIIVVALVPLMNTYYSGTLAYNTAGHETKAFNLAQAVMEEKISLSYDLLQEGDSQFNVYPGFESYSYKVKIESYKGRPDLKLLEVTVKKAATPWQSEVVLTTLLTRRH